MRAQLLSSLLLLFGAAAAGAAAPMVAFAPAAAAASPAQKARTVRATDLRDLPAGDGKLLQVVPANTEIVVIERRGGWYRVTSAGREGWMRLTAIRFAAATPDASGGFTAPLAFLKSGRSGAQTGTVTTGVRGLSETDLANSTPDIAAVDALESAAVAPADAEAFAREIGLVAAKVPLVKPPKKEKKRGEAKGDKEDKDDDEGGD